MVEETLGGREKLLSEAAKVLGTKISVARGAVDNHIIASATEYILCKCIKT
jgi:hypothetical protein